MIFAHLPAGYIQAHLNHLLYSHRTPVHHHRQYFRATLIGSIFPDLDIIWSIFQNNSLIIHRQFLTHTPFPYLVLSLLVFLASRFETPSIKRQINYALFAFLSGVLLHLITDSGIYGIRWLYPLNHNYYSVWGMPFPQLTFKEFLILYSTSIYILPEILIIVTSLLIFHMRRYARN